MCPYRIEEVDESVDTIYHWYKMLTRWVACSQHLFLSWYNVIHVGLRLDAQDYKDRAK